MRNILNTGKAVFVLLAFLFIVSGCKKDDPKPTISPAPYTVMEGFVIDGNGDKVIATDSGMFKLDITSSTYVSQELDPSFVPTNDLETFSYDPNMELYLGSNGGGLNYSTNKIYSTGTSDLVSDEVLSVGMDLNSALFFGTPKGVSIFEDGEWILHTGSSDLYLNHSITDMGTTSIGQTFVSTDGGGVGRFELSVDGISGSTIIDSEWSKIPSNNVNTVFIYDTIQVFGTDNGVGFHLSEFTKWDWEVYNTNDGLVADNVLAINRDLDENYWIGTDSGLSKFDGEVWTSFTKESSGILNNVIKFIKVDNQGAVWIASDDGLSVFSNDQWVNYPKSN